MRNNMSQAPKTTTVWLPAPERRLIEAAAAARGWGPSTYLRRVAVEAARRDIAEGSTKRDGTGKAETP